MISHIKIKSEYQGFTLIELILVIILLGIMATTVLPKFFSSDGFEAITYRNETVSKLRSIQIRAMQQTLSSFCHKVLVTEKALGVPKNCDDTLAAGWQGDTTTVVIDVSHDAIFDVSSGNYSFSFDQLGRSNCTICSITIIGKEETLQVSIEPEGYIHAN